MEIDIKQNSFVNSSRIYTEYKSDNFFDNCISKIKNIAPSFVAHHNQLVLKFSKLDTILGVMIAVSDDERLYLLEFANKHYLEKEIIKLSLKTKATIISGYTDPIAQINK